MKSKETKQCRLERLRLSKTMRTQMVIDKKKYNRKKKNRDDRYYDSFF